VRSPGAFWRSFLGPFLSLACSVQKALGRTTAADARTARQDQTDFPVQVELIPGKLKVRIFLHVIDSQKGPVPCWSYVTEGLWAHGQKELIFTLSRKPNEKPLDYSRDLLNLFKNVYELAKQGRLVNVGDYSEFGPSGFLGRSDLRGIGYVTPQILQGVKVLGPHLAGIFLTDEELAIAKSLGVTRVMANLGWAYRYYPCPPWFERDRSSVLLSKPMQEHSILTHMGRGPVQGAWILLDHEKQLFLSVLPAARSKLQALLTKSPPRAPLALLIEADPRANACMVWAPGQSGLSAITSPNSDGLVRTGNFLALVPGQPENEFRYVEDGFSLMLTDASWKVIREAMASGKPVSVPITKSGMNFQLEWVVETYESPVDGATYYATGGWHTYDTRGRHSPQKTGPVSVKHVVLLTTVEEISQRTTTEDLDALIKSVENLVDDHFALLAREAGRDLIVQCELQPGRRLEIKIASQPSIDDEIYQPLYDRLVELPGPDVKGGPVRFQIVFAVWGGASEQGAPTTPQRIQ